MMSLHKHGAARGCLDEASGGDASGKLPRPSWERSFATQRSKNGGETKNIRGLSAGRNCRRGGDGGGTGSGRMKRPPACLPVCLFVCLSAGRQECVVFAPADRCSFLLAAAAVIFKQMEKASENDSEGSERARPGVRHTHFPARMDTHKHTHTHTGIRVEHQVADTPALGERPPGSRRAAR